MQALASLTETYDDLLKKVLGRSRSLFDEDLQANNESLYKAISGAKVLVIGAAGSIGSAFVKQLMKFDPESVHLVDLSENNLVEVVRDMRSSLLTLPENFRTFSVGLGSPEFDALLKGEGPYTHVVNFAALKHVRAERDPYTLMRMLDTNVYFVHELLSKLAGATLQKFFAVSTDKSVNPANLMGATKSMMEHVMLLHSERIDVSSARFANVAFSDGSLLHSFIKRLEKRQPLSGPLDIKRYFISHEEAGQLCLFSCFLGNNREVFFPKLKAETDLYSFADIATLFLESKGLKPKQYLSEKDAKVAALSLADDGTYPCYFSSSDTSGEKPFEEFYKDTDEVDFERYQAMAVLQTPPLGEEGNRVSHALDTLRVLKNRPTWTKHDLAELIYNAVPDLEHQEKEKNLDQKM